MGKSAAPTSSSASSSYGGGGTHPTSSSSSAANDPSDNKHEQRLQAVLLADNFTNAFYPITLEPYDGDAVNNNFNNTISNNNDAGKKRTTTAGAAATGVQDPRPLILCPINNVPLLHHTIDFLQGNGVEELFILCALGADALERYIRCHAEGGGGSSGNAAAGGSGGMKSNNFASSINTDAGGGSGANKIVWSSKLMISIVRITDCTNAGE
jgi:hypothetical protein